MATLTDEQIASLKISNFLFHVVHHGKDEPEYFDDVPLGKFEPFFIARIKDTLKGNRFSFLDDSSVKAGILEWQGNNITFLELSKLLAFQFNSLYDKRVTLGVLIVIELYAGEKRYYSLIKYDSDEVVSFTRNGAKAVLEDVVNNFTQSAKSLQKSALVDLEAVAGDGHVAVIDRQTRSSISDIFRKFLGVERTKKPAELTESLHKAVIKIVTKHKDDFPASFTYRAGDQVREIAEKQKEFDADGFYNQLFGANGSDEVKATYQKEIANQGLAGEVFEYVPEALPEVRKVRYRTQEGILITVPPGAGNAFKISPDGKTITISTSKVNEI
ncbi:nucleoid-associated protein [Pseudomonas sp. XP1]